jgi:hypothetical protein
MSWPDASMATWRGELSFSFDMLQGASGSNKDR